MLHNQEGNEYIFSKLISVYESNHRGTGFPEKLNSPRGVNG
jgi:hypothetical protein